MRTSVITRFAKNTRSLSTRRTLATLATTAVLAGGIQILTTDTAWACAGPYEVTTPATPAPAATHNGDLTASFHQTRDGQTLIAGGPKVEVGVGITNFTGAPYENVAASIWLFNPVPGTGLRTEDFTVEVASGGTWKPVALSPGCDPSLHTNASPATVVKHLENGRAEHFTFRIGLSAKAPKNLGKVKIGVLGQAPGSQAVVGDSNFTFPVEHPAAAQPVPTATATATATAKPSAPAKAKTTPVAPAKPAADETKTAAPAAPTAEAPKSPAANPTSAPLATTAPAGTPELAQTGSSSANGFLAGSAAALLALGAGVLIAVRRLRPQR
ncbi:LAETG motif-containing sortase-dependent surface protein [Kitasatospora sp. NPDC057936]|uniref:LAETG motif-containing sortase-dependent surface protein n=1 Tax=Kitasatospora sp. NPDC057936 TaxID=3346283 RepID=UPI0036DF8047